MVKTVQTSWPITFEPTGAVAKLSAFRTFVRFALVWFCLFPLPPSVWEGQRFVIVALPGIFSYLFFQLLERPFCVRESCQCKILENT